MPSSERPTPSALGLVQLVGAAMLTLGWGALWITGAATLALVAAVAHVGVPADARREPGGGSPAATFLRDPRFLLLWTGSALSFFVLFAYEIVIPVVAVQDGVLALGAVGLLLAINPVLTIALQLPLTAVVRGVSRRKVLVAGTSTMGLAAAGSAVARVRARPRGRGGRLHGRRDAGIACAERRGRRRRTGRSFRGLDSGCRDVVLGRVRRCPRRRARPAPRGKRRAVGRGRGRRASLGGTVRSVPHTTAADIPSPSSVTRSSSRRRLRGHARAAPSRFIRASQARGL